MANFRSANFRSDNESTVATPILQALIQCNEGSAHSYGEDLWSQRLDERFSALFDTHVRVLPLATGTAGNSIALAELCPAWGGVICHPQAHIHTDECGAPEFYNPGCKLLPVAGPEGKLCAQAVAASLALRGAHGVHEILASALSLTQSTESGTVYSCDEVHALSAVAQEYQLGVHMDGSRFANAVAHLDCHPAEISWRAGVDILSFGASKNGALAAEALIVFESPHLHPQIYANLERRRKRAGHLLSKMRYISAQLLAYVEDDLWLKLASHANTQAARFAQAIEQHPEASLAYPVQANEVFLRYPEAKLTAMQAQGLEFHLWPGSSDLARFVFSHATSDDEVEQLLRALQQS